jgi:hypothetical protein
MFGATTPSWHWRQVSDVVAVEKVGCCGSAAKAEPAAASKTGRTHLSPRKQVSLATPTPGIA